MSKFSSFQFCLATSFFSLCSCDDQLLLTVCGLRNQIVAGTLLVLACRLSTRSASVSYSLVPLSWLQLCTIHLQASSKRQLRNSTGNRITDRVVVTRIHSQCKHTHTLERTAFPNAHRIPQGVFNNRTIQMIHLSSHAVRLISPITVITGWR